MEMPQNTLIIHCVKFSDKNLDTGNKCNLIHDICSFYFLLLSWQHFILETHENVFISFCNFVKFPIKKRKE